MATTTTTSSVLLKDFKESKGIRTMEVFESKSGKFYACNKDTGEFIGMVQDNLDTSKPVFVNTCVNDETKEDWLYISNAREAKYTL